MMKKSFPVCIDFDGVLAEYHGYKGPHKHGVPLPGCREFLQRLVAAKIPFVVLTTRDEKKGILAWFKKHTLPMPKDVTNKKVIALAYIDDRAVHFDGDYKNLLRTLKKFHVHWKKPRPFKDL
ncbi:MAG: hypothetical protein AABY13_05420 [Nanoarchaeota archaeon]